MTKKREKSKHLIFLKSWKLREGSEDVREGFQKKPANPALWTNHIIARDTKELAVIRNSFIILADCINIKEKNPVVKNSEVLLNQSQGKDSLVSAISMCQSPQLTILF